jgi:hypothetical protein
VSSTVTFLGVEEGSREVAWVEVGNHVLYPNQPESGVSDADVKRLKALPDHKFRVEADKSKS